MKNKTIAFQRTASGGARTCIAFVSDLGIHIQRLVSSMATS